MGNRQSQRATLRSATMTPINRDVMEWYALDTVFKIRKWDGSNWSDGVTPKTSTGIVLKFAQIYEDSGIWYGVASNFSSYKIYNTTGNPANGDTRWSELIGSGSASIKYISRSRYGIWFGIKENGKLQVMNNNQPADKPNGTWTDFDSVLDPASSAYVEEALSVASGLNNIYGIPDNSTNYIHGLNTSDGTWNEVREPVLASGNRRKYGTIMAGPDFWIAIGTDKLVYGSTSRLDEQPLFDDSSRVQLGNLQVQSIAYPSSLNSPISGPCQGRPIPPGIDQARLTSLLLEIKCILEQ